MGQGANGDSSDLSRQDRLEESVTVKAQSVSDPGIASNGTVFAPNGSAMPGSAHHVDRRLSRNLQQIGQFSLDYGEGALAINVLG